MIPLELKNSIILSFFKICCKEEAMINLQLLPQIICLLWLFVPLATAASSPSMALPNCMEVCGNVPIPYPFGIGEGCYRDEWYAITCNNSFIPNKPFLSKFKLEVLDVDLVNQLVRLNIPTGIAAASRCPGEASTTLWSINFFRGSPFNFSSSNNEFTVVGCDNAIIGYQGKTEAGCTSLCLSNTNSITTSSSTEGCYGIACCQTSIPTDLDMYTIIISGNTIINCTYAFLAQRHWYPGNLSNPYAIYETEHIPVVMDWAPVNSVGILSGGKYPSYNYCFSTTKAGYIICECGWAYQGNPYIPNGCAVIEACASCKKECDKSPGGEPYCNHNNKTEITIGLSLGAGMLLLLLCGFYFSMYKLLKKRRIMKHRKKFFKRNGGLLLQQQISSDEGTVDKTYVFTSKELEKATDNFNENRILGQGGQGTVYKGMLSDGKIVAIKKSTVVDESKLEQFINEVVILSQINHRNIVKLLGCCLETEVPLLVYEFISNGNLFQLIHGQNDEFPLSWKMRLQIATEVAGALAYLHSASSTPIYHRDIKSTNILLDEKFRAIVADFGTSRSIAIEQTHLTTVVKGTFGYLDPEYFQSSQFTEKSDVYSFGVVLVELLTGQKAISSILSEEDRSLATRFISSLKAMRLFDLLDSRVVQEARQEEIGVIADIAKRCLNLSGKKRPTMREVMVELEGIRMSHMPSNLVRNVHEDECIIEMKGPIYDASSSNQSAAFVYHSSLSTDVDPLLFHSL